MNVNWLFFLQISSCSEEMNVKMILLKMAPLIPSATCGRRFFFQDRIKEDGKHPDAELKF